MPRRSIKVLEHGKKAADTRHNQWLGSWRDAYRYTLPQRDITDQPKPGQVKGDLVFDSTAVNSASQFANRMQDAIFPPFQDFFELQPGPDAKGNEQQVGKILGEITEKYHAAHHRSNFDVVIGEGLLELSIGTMVLMLNKGPFENPFNFVAVPIPQVRLEEGAWGGVGGYYRHHKMPLSVYRQQWPDGNVPHKWEELAKENPDELVEFEETTYYDHDEKQWYYDLWLGEDEVFLLEKPRIYDRQSPWLAVRWMKAANEVYGRGPVLSAMADIRTVNRVKELLLQNASMMVPGIYTVAHDGITNPYTARLQPGAFIPVGRNPGHPQGASIAPLERAGDVDLAAFVLQDMIQNIRRMLFDEGLPPETGAVRSATEIIQRLKEVQVNQGPAFARINKELIHPMVERGLVILQEHGIIEFPVKVDGKIVEVRATSPLAQAQNLNDLQSTVQWIELQQALTGPEITMLSTVLERFGPWAAAKLGVDNDLVREDASKEQLQAMVAQMLASMQQPQPQPGADAPQQQLPGGVAQ